MNCTRRGFLKGGIGSGVLATAPVTEGHAVFEKRAGLKGFQPLKLRRVTLRVGASRPFKAIHLSDTHLARAAQADGEEKICLAAARHADTWFGEYYLWQAIEKARRTKALLLHSGDMIDFVSEANLAFAERVFGSDDWFVAAGNHEYSRFLGEAREDAAYKAGSYAKVSAHYPNDLTFASRIVNGVNFVSADNVYYNFTEKQLALMKREVAKGLPMVFLCHVPIYVHEHYERQMAKTGGLCAYETGVPPELVSLWKGPAFDRHNWRDRRVQQRTDAATAEFVAYLKAQSLVRAVLCGHCHEFWLGRFSPSAVMCVADATYQGWCSELTFV